MFWRKQTIECPYCRGTGSIQTRRKGEIQCEKCKGTGEQIRVNPLICWIFVLIVIIVLGWLIFSKPNQTQATSIPQVSIQPMNPQTPLPTTPVVNSNPKTFADHVGKLAIAFYVASGLPAFAALLLLEGIGTILVFIATNIILGKTPPSIYKFAMKTLTTICMVYVWYSAGVAIGGWGLFAAGAIPNLLFLTLVWGYRFDYADGGGAEFEEGEISSYYNQRKVSVAPSRDDNN